MRHNWVAPPDNPLVDLHVVVEETYTYGGLGGLTSARTTTVGDGSSVDQSFTQGWVYDALGRVSTVTYPTCTFSQCTDDVPTPGWTPAPTRTVSFTYTDGALTAVPGFASSISYHPSGLMSEVVHSDGAIFTQEPDPWGMRRPAALGISGIHSLIELGLWDPAQGQGGLGYTTSTLCRPWSEVWISVCLSRNGEKSSSGGGTYSSKVREEVVMLLGGHWAERVTAEEMCCVTAIKRVAFLTFNLRSEPVSSGAVTSFELTQALSVQEFWPSLL